MLIEYEFITCEESNLMEENEAQESYKWGIQLAVNLLEYIFYFITLFSFIFISFYTYSLYIFIGYIKKQFKIFVLIKEAA